MGYNYDQMADEYVRNIICDVVCGANSCMHKVQPYNFPIRSLTKVKYNP